VLLVAGCGRYEPGSLPQTQAITDDAAWDGDAAPSPDGKWVAFVSERDGWRGLHVRPAGEGEVRTLVTGAGDVSRPVWSPDGTRLLFARADSSGSASRLYQIELGGGAPRPLGLPTRNARDGVYSPDGESVACVFQGDSTWALATVRLADFAVHPRVQGAPGDPPERPAWTPDGSAIVFSWHGDLWSVGAEAGEPMALTSRPSREVEPAVSPDGRWIAFVSDSTGTANIWIARLSKDSRRESAGGKAPTMTLGPWRPVTATFEHARRPAWSRDGKQLWFERTSTWAVLARDVGGTRPDTLSSSLFDSRDPSYSSDGLHVLFTSNRSGNDDLWIVNASGEAATGPARQLTRSPEPDFEGEWSRATGQIAYVVERAGKLDLALTDTDGDDLGKLTDDVAPDGEPCWSPDGRSIAFVSGRSGSSEVYVLEGVGRSLQGVTASTPGGATGPAWTPDGRFLLYTAPHRGRPSIWRVDVSGGSPAPLTTDDVPGSWDARPRVSPDGGRVAFMRARRGNRDLWTMDLATGEARPLVENPASQEDFPDWSSDGRRVVYQSGGATNLYRADVRPLLRR
jgi:TolB protein